MYNPTGITRFSLVAAALLLTGCGTGDSSAGSDSDVDASVQDVALTDEDVGLANGEHARGEPTKSKEELREMAKTDPEAANVQSIDQMSGNEVVATAINSAGHLCGRVTDMYPSNGSILVYCTENCDGSGRVKYRVDAQAGTVEPL